MDKSHLSFAWFFSEASCSSVEIKNIFLPTFRLVCRDVSSKTIYTFEDRKLTKEPLISNGREAQTILEVNKEQAEALEAILTIMSIHYRQTAKKIKIEPQGILKYKRKNLLKRTEDLD